MTRYWLQTRGQVLHVQDGPRRGLRLNLEDEEEAKWEACSPLSEEDLYAEGFAEISGKVAAEIAYSRCGYGI